MLYFKTTVTYLALANYICNALYRVLQTNLEHKWVSPPRSSKHYSNHFVISCFLSQGSKDIIFSKWWSFVSLLESVLIGICLEDNSSCLLFCITDYRSNFSAYSIYSFISLWWPFSINLHSTELFSFHLSHWKLNVSFMTKGFSIFLCNFENINFPY